LTAIGKVLAKAGKMVTPSSAEKAALDRTTHKVLAKVEAAAESFEEVTKVATGGSFAKGTWLPGDVDIDIFVKISPRVDEARFELIGLSVGREAARGYPHGKKYAQHPYTEAIVDGVKVNVVPCYDVKAGEWKSAADRSPYHVEFVRKHMDEEKKTQVRLLKRFMKVVGVYGAEIEKEGFSGYATEVLVHLHGGFEEALGYFATLKPTDGVLFALKDPIDEGRELSRAISKESVARMVLASRAFLDRPNLGFFKKVAPPIRNGLRNRLYAVRFDHRRLSEDTLWGELKKSTRRLVKYVEGQGYTISRAAACSNDLDASAIILLPETEALSEIEERVGPGVELASEVDRFIAKNHKRAELVWAAEDGRIHILQKRASTELSSLLADVRANILLIGASREVARSIKRNGRVLHGAALEKETSKEEWFREGVEQVVTDSFGTDIPR
jgi:tRNA nucleotidyltransferase (CCA-adding enzyme)